MNIKTKLNDNWTQLKELLKHFLPENRTEVWILTISILVYLSYSIIIALGTSIIDNTEMMYDVYFSFDNPCIFLKGYTYIDGHPLMILITRPFILLGDILAKIFIYKVKTIFIVTLCSTLVSLSLLYVYRYLTQIIKLDKKISFLFLFFYGFSSTCLILAFTPESFTISLFLLSFTLYTYSHYISNKQKVRLLTSTFLTVALGGITITNFTKGIIPILFLDEKWKLKIHKILVPTLILIFILIFWQTHFDFIGDISSRIYSEPKMPARGVYLKRVFDWFYASPIFLPSSNLLHYTKYNVDAIVLDFYNYWWQYFFAISLFIILIYTFFLNYKNKLIQIIFLFLLQDITIHVIIGYGLRDPFIFGGHWIFIVPILLGWSYKSIKNKKFKCIYIGFLTSLLILLIINNSIQLYNFIVLAFKHFPA